MVHMNAGCLQRVWTVVEFDTCRKVDWLLKVDCVASSVTGLNSDGSLGTLKERVYSAPSRTVSRSHGKTSGGLLGMFKRMPCSALLSALIWMEATSNTCCYYDVLMVLSSDSLCHETVTCILKTKCYWGDCA
jgi:hypothetical protein